MNREPRRAARLSQKSTVFARVTRGTRVTPNHDWTEFEGREFQIRGHGGSSVRFVSEAVLAHEIVETGVVAFRVEVDVSTPNSKMQESLSWSDYSGLRPLRESLSCLRNGTSKSTRVSGAGFSMDIRLHEAGVSEILLVQGSYSSAEDARESGWHAGIVDRVALDRQAAMFVQFAFPSSLIDPPFVDNAFTQLDEIIADLKANGYNS